MRLKLSDLSKKRSFFLSFILIVISLEGGANDDGTFYGFDSDGYPYDIHGKLKIVSHPQKPNIDCIDAGLTEGSYVILDSNPGRNSPDEWHYHGEMKGYCEANRVKTFNRRNILICDDYNYVSPMNGSRLCKLAQQRTEQIKTNIELAKKIDTANKLIIELGSKVEALKKCQISSDLCNANPSSP